MESSISCFSASSDIFFKVRINKSTPNPRTITITNYKESCAIKFNQTYANNGNSISMEERIKIYQEYLDEGDYNMLLDERYTDGAAACNHVDCNYNLSGKCLYGSVSYGDFTASGDTLNLSCYNDTLLYGTDIVGYCQDTFELVHPSELNDAVNYGFSAKRGLAFIKNDIAAKGTITKTCYMLDTSKVSGLSQMKSYDEIIYGVSLKYRSKNFIDSSNSADWSNPVISGNEVKFTATKNYNFTFLYLNREKNGKLDLSSCDDCVDEERGIMSDPADDSDSGIMPFSFTFESPQSGSKKKIDKSCKYDLKGNYDPDNIEFRPIDTNNPFPGKDGIGRNTGKNWCNGSDCANNNKTVEDYIKSRDNSYTQTAKYVIELNAADIKAIKEYNKGTNYDDANYRYFNDTALVPQPYSNYEECKANNNNTSCTIKSVFLENLIQGIVGTNPINHRLTIRNG